MNTINMETRSDQEPAKPVTTVLVVDDYPDNVESMALLLRHYGYEVHVALSGRSAIELAETHRPDVVLCDILMPGLSGFEVAKHMRKRFKDVLIIAITASSFENARFRQAGFDFCFLKPADPQEIHRLLKTALKTVQ